MVGNIGNSHGCSIPARSPFTLSPALRPWGGHGAGTSQRICQIPQLSGNKHRDYETDPYSLSRSTVIWGGHFWAGLPTAIAGAVASSRCLTLPGREERGRRASGAKAAPMHYETSSGCNCLCPRSAFNRSFPKSPLQEAFLSLGFQSLLVLVVPRGAPLWAGGRAFGHFWGMLCSEPDPVCAPQPHFPL